MGWNDFSLPGCGECFDNEDGTSRQDELRRCQRGEEAHLVREPGNPHDPLAVAIVSKRGVRVGYLRRQYAQWIAPKIDDGRVFPAAIVERVKGIDLPGSSLGIVLRVSLDGEEPELPASAMRRVA